MDSKDEHRREVRRSSPGPAKKSCYINLGNLSNVQCPAKQLFATPSIHILLPNLVPSLFVYCILFDLGNYQEGEKIRALDLDY